MPASVNRVRWLLITCVVSLLMLAAYFWYRFWIPADGFPGVAAEAARVEQTVTLISSVDGALEAVDARESGGEPLTVKPADAEAFEEDAAAEDFNWRIPPWLPPPPVPDDNPMSEVKVSLGRHLFYDHRLSLDNSVACASCHLQSQGFADGQALSLGVGGSITVRNAMGLANVGYSPSLTWANPHLKTLERQSLVPLFSEEPVEMGLAGQEQKLFGKLQGDPLYRDLFARSFPERGGRIELATITRALAAFQRTLISVGSPYDRYQYGGEKEALSEAALRGESFFYSEQAECYHCHQGFNFTDTVQTANSGFSESAFYNTGLYNLDSQGSYPVGGKGLYELTGKASDMGKFRTQSLRNVAVTAPYFHDGSAATLDDVIDHYATAGRTLQGNLAGNGSTNPYKDPLIGGFDISESVREDLKAFLHSLTDADFLGNPRFSDPWPEGHPARGVASSSPDYQHLNPKEFLNP